MKIITPLFFFVLLGITSCKQDMKPTYLPDDGSNKNSNTPNTLPNPTLAPNSATAINPAQNPTIVPNQVTSVNPVITKANSAGLNPEHGKPGHRCDIAVGAPLSSKPTTNVKNPQQQIVIDPSSMVKQNVAPNNKLKQKTAPGMNPPHGEPGHRCDIAVGAPLNSPSGKNAVQNVTQNSSAPVSTTPPNALPATIAAPTTSAQIPALGADGNVLTVNPAHGQPGHRCDIAVGAPLK